VSQAAFPIPIICSFHAFPHPFLYIYHKPLSYVFWLARLFHNAKFFLLSTYLPRQSPFVILLLLLPFLTHDVFFSPSNAFSRIKTPKIPIYKF
jgi:hypothetical protein